jgi:hypothetical protein
MAAVNAFQVTGPRAAADLDSSDEKTANVEGLTLNVS